MTTTLHLKEHARPANGPTAAPRTRLPVGYELNDAQTGIGFTADVPALLTDSAGQVVSTDLEAGLMCCAPTGAGKSTGLSMPISLMHHGPFIALDPKGELVKATAAYREACGSAVGVLDPFNALANARHGGRRIAFNPLEVITKSDRNDAADLAREMASVIVNEGNGAPKIDPFWADAARSVLTGLLVFVGRYAPKAQRHLGTVVDLAFAEETCLAGALAAMMRCGTDHGGVIRNSANLVISAPERTRESILTTLRVNMSWLASPPIRAHLANPNVSLNVVRTGTLRGAPVSLYGVVPMDKLESHAPLLRLWTLAMFSELLKREHVPEQSTLFLAEEAATLGALPALKTAFCQLRGNGVSPALIYQDPAQVRAIWGDSWTLFRNNADVVSVFGARHPAAARDYGDFVGWSGDLSHMDQTTQVVSIRGEGLRQLRRLSVVQDGWLAKRMYSPDYDKGASVHAG